jgi:KDO2-lipid IV(A) lauroyltransferase
MALIKKEYSDTVIYGMLYAVVWLMSRIPLGVGQSFGRILGKIISRFPIDRFRISEENLQITFGDHLTPAEVKSLNRKVIMHFGQVIFEIPHILRLNRKNLHEYVIFENERHLINAMEEGKGVFVLTGHFGNWEIMSAAIAIQFAEKGAVIARPFDFTPMDRLISGLRSRFGALVISKQRGMKRILKAVQENRVIGILLDQNVDWYSGVFVHFLGRWACTNSGLALIAQKTGTPVVPAFPIRQDDGKYRVIFEKKIDLLKTGKKTGDLEGNTTIFTGIIERYIRQYPDHWFWFHRRWKTALFWPLPENRYSQTAGSGR